MLINFSTVKNVLKASVFNTFSSFSTAKARRKKSIKLFKFNYFWEPASNRREKSLTVSWIWSIIDSAAVCPADNWIQKDNKMHGTIISASILNSDLSDLRSTARKVDESGAGWLHFDVMDGSFVENITFGSSVLKAVKPYSGAFFDVHLMVTDPTRQIKLFAEAGADNITIHAESGCDTLAVLREIHSAGIGAGIALKPRTPASAVLPFINDVDMILVMTVEPGYGGQGFMPDMLPKIKELRALAPDKDIEVDGGINAETAKLVKEAGANILVAGTYLFRSEDMHKAAENLKNA